MKKAIPYSLHNSTTHQATNLATRFQSPKQDFCTNLCLYHAFRRTILWERPLIKKPSLIDHHPSSDQENKFWIGVMQLCLRFWWYFHSYIFILFLFSLIHLLIFLSILNFDENELRFRWKCFRKDKLIQITQAVFLGFLRQNKL